MSLRTMICIDLAFAAIVLAASSVGHGQVYKWVDEKGTVNYGNKPPATARGGKAPTVVEDRVSVYTPEPGVAQATQNARDRSGLPNTARTFSSQPDRNSPPTYSSAPSASPSQPNDPCAMNADPNCYGYPGYNGYVNRNRPPQLNQPQLPPGAIAGNVNGGNGYIPGLSSQAPPPPTPAAPMMRSAPSNGGTFGNGGAFGRRDDDRGSGRGR
jgi:hypothetical protein